MDGFREGGSTREDVHLEAIEEPHPALESKHLKSAGAISYGPYRFSRGGGVASVDRQSPMLLTPSSVGSRTAFSEYCWNQFLPD